MSPAESTATPEGSTAPGTEYSAILAPAALSRNTLPGPPPAAAPGPGASRSATRMLPSGAMAIPDGFQNAAPESNRVWALVTGSILMTAPQPNFTSSGGSESSHWVPDG